MLSSVLFSIHPRALIVTNIISYMAYVACPCIGYIELIQVNYTTNGLVSGVIVLFSHIYDSDYIMYDMRVVNNLYRLYCRPAPSRFLGILKTTECTKPFV